jgi:hypothetical protein
MRVRRALLEAGESPDVRGQQRPGRAGAVRSLRMDQNPRQASGGPYPHRAFQGAGHTGHMAPRPAQLVGGPPDHWCWAAHLLPGAIHVPRERGSVGGPLTLQCSVGQPDLAVGGDVRPLVLSLAASSAWHVSVTSSRQADGCCVPPDVVCQRVVQGAASRRC